MPYLHHSHAASSSCVSTLCSLKSVSLTQELPFQMFPSVRSHVIPHLWSPSDSDLLPRPSPHPFTFWRCPASLVSDLISGLRICHMGNPDEALTIEDVSPKPLPLTPDVWALPSKLLGERRNWPKVLYYVARPWLFLFLFSQQREPFLTTVLASTRAFGHGPLDHKFCKERIHLDSFTIFTALGTL